MEDFIVMVIAEVVRFAVEHWMLVPEYCHTLLEAGGALGVVGIFSFILWLSMTVQFVPTVIFWLVSLPLGFIAGVRIYGGWRGGWEGVKEILPGFFSMWLAFSTLGLSLLFRLARDHARYR